MMVMLPEIKVGSIYKMRMDERNDVTPKDSMNFRPKFFIVIGSADYGYYVAYVLINKSINRTFISTKQLLDCQFPLRVKDYPGIFTIDPSFVNLARIREIEVYKLLREAEFCGELTVSDLQLVLETLKESPVITNKEKRRYGIV